MQNLTKIETPEQMARMGLNAQIEKLKAQAKIVEDSVLSTEKKEEVSCLLAIELGRLLAIVEAL